MDEFDKVVGEGYCIGCGNCKVISPTKVDIKLNEIGLYQPKLNSSFNEKENEIFIKVCPFSGSSKSEDEYSDELYNHNLHYSKSLGRYNKVLVGGVSNIQKRIGSSSGGLTTYLVEKLLVNGMVDGVINVCPSTTSGEAFFEYTITDSISGLNNTKKSRYHVVTYSNLIDVIMNFNGRLAFIGVPCFVKSIRLLSEENNILKEKIKYHIALFCGHQKSVAYSEYLASQICGIGNLKRINYIDFRVKDLNANADQYLIEVGLNNGEKLSKRAKEIRWTDWGLGLFKPKACDYCDDVAGEVADVIFGDAWIKPYASDPLGTNIVITRNTEIENIFETGLLNGEIKFDEKGEAEVLQAQGGNFRHRKEGLLSRVEHKEKLNMWYPKPRKSLYSNFKLNKKRHQLYLKRQIITDASHRAFMEAKLAGDISLFYSRMDEHVSQYYKLNRSFKKELKSLIKKLIRK